MSADLEFGVLGLLLLLGGTLLAADFRGFTSWYSRFTAELGGAFSVRRNETSQRRRERLRFAYTVVRIVGGIFGAFGALMILAVIEGLISSFRK
ncbi:hypothetical protein [Actinoplanes sp. NPDC051411]|uniref:hypothetical protein n=1 Tax=Actinoplanes sp. NPDC051411 TaxID=3155522 RepID=UPI00341ADA12